MHQDAQGSHTTPYCWGVTLYFTLVCHLSSLGGTGWLDRADQINNNLAKLKFDEVEKVKCQWKCLLNLWGILGGLATSLLSQNNLNSKAKNLLDNRKFKMDLPLGLTILLKFKSMLMVMVPMIYLGITVLSSVSKSSREKCIIRFAFVLLQWMDVNLCWCCFNVQTNSR